MDKALINEALQVVIEAGRLSQDYIRLLGSCRAYDSKSIGTGAGNIESISLNAAQVAMDLLFTTSKKEKTELSKKLDDYCSDLIIWRALYDDIWTPKESGDSEGEKDECD